MRAVWGAAAMLAAVVLGAVLWGGPFVVLWQLTFAQPCPGGSGCVPARVTDRFDDPDGTVTLSLDVPPGTITLDPESADRLGITGDVRGGEPINLTFAGPDLVALTTPNGHPVPTTAGIRTAAALRLLLLTTAVITIALTTARFWRRHTPRPHLTRAALSLAAGTLAALITGGPAGALNPAWTLPTTLITLLLTTLGAATLRPPTRNPNPQLETRRP